MIYAIVFWSSALAGFGLGGFVATILISGKYRRVLQRLAEANELMNQAEATNKAADAIRETARVQLDEVKALRAQIVEYPQSGAESSKPH